MLMAVAHITVALLLQSPRQRAPRQQIPSVRGGDTDAVATFTGAFKSADKKFFTIEVESGESIRMYITGATKFVRAGKPAHVKDFQPGESVTADAARDARMNLLAIRVESAPPAR